MFNSNEIKKVQNEILSIFIEIDKLCEKHNLRYYAIGGTCIGAVRHNGFIPWDDDLDIAMPRKDYERFIAIASEELPKHLKLFLPTEIEHFECVFCKVHNINTTFIQRYVSMYPDRYTGVYVDIMPLDGQPNDGSERKKHYKRLKKLGLLNLNRRKNCQDLHSGLRSVLWYPIKKMIDLRSFHAYYDEYTAELKKYDFDSSLFTGYGWCNLLEKLTFPQKDFSDYILFPFEDYHMRCPIGYDDFLSIMFGDYMQLPSESEQQPSHDAFIDLDTPYKTIK